MRLERRGYREGYWVRQDGVQRRHWTIQRWQTGFRARQRPFPAATWSWEDLLRRGGEGVSGFMGDGGLPETQLLALAQRQAERDRELAAAHRCGVIGRLQP